MEKDDIQYEIEDDEDVGASVPVDEDDGADGDNDDAGVPDDDGDAGSDDADVGDDEKPRRKKKRSDPERRINSLVAKLKEKDELLAKLNDRLTGLERTTQESQYRQQAAAIEHRERAAKAKRDDLQAKYTEAIEGGDSAAQAKLLTDLMEATQAVRDIERARKSRQQRPVQSGQAAPQQEQQPQYPKNVKEPSPAAKSWYEKNQSWFGEKGDQELTKAALRINNALLGEGWDDTSTEYYEELDRRVQAFSKRKRGGGQVAAPSRQPGNASGKVRITKGMAEKARKLGVPIEAYAREVAKMQKEGKL